MTLLTQFMAAERQRELMRMAAEHRRQAPGRLRRRRDRAIPPPAPAPAAPPMAAAADRRPDCGMASHPTGP